MRQHQEARFGSYSALVWLTVVVFLSVAATVADQRQWLALPRSLATRVLAPVQQSVAAATRRSITAATSWGKTNQLQAENEALRRRVAALQQEVLRLQGTVLENRQLREQLRYTETHRDLEFAPADVIGRDSSNLLGYIILNRGSSADVREGMVVVTPAGLVGRVIAVNDRTATVLPINHPTSAVNARIYTVEAATGIVSGLPNGQLILRHLPPQEPVHVNDLVITSGLGGGFPQDLAIGRVTRVRSRDVAMFQEATVAPLVAFGQLDRVLIVTNFVPVDFPANIR